MKIHIIKNLAVELKVLLGVVLELIKSAYFSVLKVLHQSIEIVLPLFERILFLVVKNVLIMFIVSFSASLLTYTVSPELFHWVLKKLNISLTGLSELKQLEDQQKEIKNLVQSIETLQDEKSVLLDELNASLGKNQGMVEEIKSITLEKINWWNVILTISGVTVVLGGVAYFIFSSGSNGDFFKPRIALISNNNQDIKVITDNTVKIFEQIAKLDKRIDLLKNAIELINKKN